MGTEHQPEAPAVPGVTRFRKKPVIVETILWDGANAEAVREFCGKRSDGEDLFEPPAGVGRAAIWNDQEQGWIPLPVGHRVVKGALNEVYPISPEAVAQTYEPAGEEKAPAVPPPPVAAALDREHLGRIVHEQRRAFEAERSALKDRPGFILAPWEDRHPEQQELDMQIGEAVAAAERERIRELADRTGAACTGDEGTSCYFAALLEGPGTPVKTGTEPKP